MMSQQWGSFNNGFTTAVTQSNSTPSKFVRYWEIGEHHELMQQLASFLDTVLETDQIPFDIRNQYGSEQAVRNPVGVTGFRTLSNLMPLCGQWLDLYWPGYAYSADMQLFSDCFMQHPFSRLFVPGSSETVDKATAARLYNDFVSRLRSESVHRGVKKSIADWKANIRGHNGTIRRYLAGLMSRYERLVPIRVDLNYLADAFGGSDAMPRMSWAMTGQGEWVCAPSDSPPTHGTPETRARFDTAVAMADRDRFFDNQRGVDHHLFDRMVGYICKLEQGGKSGANHFHCVFFIDAKGLTGADVEVIRHGLSDRWRRVTRWQGVMFDCHDEDYRRSVESRRTWAVDAVDCANPVQTATLVEYLVWYFAKEKSQLVRVKPSPRARTLTTGR